MTTRFDPREFDRDHDARYLARCPRWRSEGPVRDGGLDRGRAATVGPARVW